MAATSDRAAGTRPGALLRMVGRLLPGGGAEAPASEPVVPRQRRTPIHDIADRDHVMVSGTVRSVMLRSRAGSPALEAELYDGSGALSIVWLGRRQIAGIRPGRHLVAEGRVSEAAGRRVMFNPKYELGPGGDQ